MTDIVGLVSRPSHLIKSKPHPTGDLLSNTKFPPEARGDDFRKWLLVKDIFSPTREILNTINPPREQKPSTMPTPNYNPTFRISLTPSRRTVLALIGRNSGSDSTSARSSTYSYSGSRTSPPMRSTEYQCVPLSKEAVSRRGHVRSHSSARHPGAHVHVQAHVGFVPSKKNLTNVIVRF